MVYFWKLLIFLNINGKKTELSFFMSMQSILWLDIGFHQKDFQWKPKFIQILVLYWKYCQRYANITLILFFFKTLNRLKFSWQYWQNRFNIGTIFHVSDCNIDLILSQDIVSIGLLLGTCLKGLEYLVYYMYTILVLL